MAKKSLTKRIEDLTYAIEGVEPRSGYFKGELVNILASVEKLENGAAIREAEAKIAALESALEKSDAAREESNAEFGKLKGELKAANAEIEKFRAEQKERENADLPDEQVELLRILQPKSLGMMQLSEILESISLREDAAILHLEKLQELKLADFSHHSIGYEMWYRTARGNADVIARRMAERGDLPDIAEKILAELSPPGRAPGRADMTAASIAFLFNIAEDLALGYLERLRAAGFAIRAYTGKGTLWSRHPDGTEYLKAKRLAGEGGDQEQRKYADLPAIQHKVLVIVGSDPDGVFDQAIANKIGATLSLTVHTLKLLRKADMATDGGAERVIFGDDGSLWWTMEKGEEYLAERELL